jgi:hypothetical protein
MARTPETIQQRFHLPAECGVRAIPRVHHAFRGNRSSDRLRYLATVYPAIVAGSLHGEGSPIKWQKQVTQKELAARSGCARPSYTRNLSRFSEKVESNRRKQAIEPLPVLTRQRRFGQANHMGFALPQREEMFVVVETNSGRQKGTFYAQQAAATECERLERVTREPHQVELVPVDKREYRMATLAQLIDASNPGHEWWDESFAAEGFKQTSCWYWDPRISDPDTGKSFGRVERLVMSAYEHFGLLEEFHDGGKVTKPKGILYIHQAKVAAYVGISVRRLYDAHKKWEKLEVLRIAHDRRKPGSEDGQPDRWTSGPQIVLYVPTRKFTMAEEQDEKVRMKAREQEIITREGLRRQAQLERVRTIHQELLRAWTGTERTIGTFWRELDTALTDAGIDEDIICKIVPIRRPPE